MLAWEFFVPIGFCPGFGRVRQGGDHWRKLWHVLKRFQCKLKERCGQPPSFTELKQVIHKIMSQVFQFWWDGYTAEDLLAALELCVDFWMQH